MKIRCVSIRQPFASAVVAGLKDREYRSWPTRHRGELAVHAALRAMLDEDGYPSLGPVRLLPRGVILGLVELVDVEVDGCDYAWILGNPRTLLWPAPQRGFLGLFWCDLPD